MTDKNPDFTAGTVVITEPGKTVEIVSLRPIGTPNIVYLGAVTAWPRDKDSIAEADTGYPGSSIKKHHPAIGTVISAAETAFKGPKDTEPGSVWVYAGFRLASGTQGGVFDVEVTYKVDGKQRTERSKKTFLVCKAPCRGDDYKDVDEWRDVMEKELGSGEVKAAS